MRKIPDSKLRRIALVYSQLMTISTSAVLLLFSEKQVLLRIAGCLVFSFIYLGLYKRFMVQTNSPARKLVLMSYFQAAYLGVMLFITTAWIIGALVIVTKPALLMLSGANGLVYALMYVLSYYVREFIVTGRHTEGSATSRSA